ncbi:hypothetical protein RHMOL_Rhmol05G0156600 [Rhododendron molle]|uniref:Uncharacterized protein n=1 Tax=Rhododendron molle TaxID=49168 RepID=A0ACC0NQX7_RHOML|nr:hypothetical protein RHMOL_Rhmol05G0156600 [Rhododendron molle]
MFASKWAEVDVVVTYEGLKWQHDVAPASVFGYDDNMLSLSFAACLVLSELFIWMLWQLMKALNGNMMLPPLQFLAMMIIC